MTTRTHLMQTISLRRLAVAFGFLAFSVLFALTQVDARAAFTSSEYRFFELSMRGLHIVPASCPSYPHAGGDGNCASNTYCTVSASPSSLYTGQSTTITWDSTYPGAEYVIMNDGAGQRPISGSVSKTPTSDTVYVVDVYTSGANYVGSCSVIVAVSRAGGSECSPQYYCSGKDLYFRNSTCIASLIQSCAFACAGGACIDPETPGEGGDMNITVSPSLVRRGVTTTVTWSSFNMASCVVTENNPDFVDTWNTENGTDTSSAITQQTVYTLTCVGENDETYVDTATVNVLPDWVEK